MSQPQPLLLPSSLLNLLLPSSLLHLLLPSSLLNLLLPSLLHHLFTLTSLLFRSSSLNNNLLSSAPSLVSLATSPRLLLRMTLIRRHRVNFISSLTASCQPPSSARVSTSSKLRAKVLDTNRRTQEAGPKKTA
eukprot:452790-Hanusia_phi.AAC.1